MIVSSQDEIRLLTHQRILLLRLYRENQGMRTSRRKQESKRAAYELNVMYPMRSTMTRGGRMVVWLPEDVSKKYARKVHLNGGGVDVAHGAVGYYQNGRRQRGRARFHWSLAGRVLVTEGKDLRIRDACVVDCLGAFEGLRTFSFDSKGRVSYWGRD